ncbi:MAG TPA: hemerythrin domain-containing protein [Polyangiaceae bacterium]|jgi:hemerythrin-like domain-containing protein|nr:hemerythrin domain-containing protein [Polyangiaceae bacterium]
MHALLSLIREHEVISRLLDGLAGYARRLVDPQGRAADPQDLAAFAQVFRGFADELHHEKEEEILQPILSRHGFHWTEGLLADVRTDHQRERYLMEVLGQAAECELEWTDEDRRSIAATALAFVRFEREHLQMENEQLFPEVIRRSGGDVLEELRVALERFDRVPRHMAVRAEVLRVADDLITRYAPAARTAGSAPAPIEPAANATR